MQECTHLSTGAVAQLCALLLAHGLLPAHLPDLHAQELPLSAMSTPVALTVICDSATHSHTAQNEQSLLNADPISSKYTIFGLYTAFLGSQLISGPQGS